MENYQLAEKIYSASNEDYERKPLYDFFQEVIRRRTYNIEGGLQAAFVIVPDKIGAKVCEEDGKALHVHSHINILRFLNGNNDYIPTRKIRQLNLYREEQLELITQGVEGRIISNPEELDVIIFAHQARLSPFQNSMIEEIVDICREIRDNSIYDTVNVGISTEELSLEYGELTEEKVEKVKNYFRRRRGSSK